jgi:hypothetical protein
VIVFLLLSVFGSKLVFSSVFYTKDKHLLYQAFGPTTVCLKDPLRPDSAKNRGESDVFVQFVQDFTTEEGLQVLKKWDDMACRSKFKLEIGSIGSEVIEVANLEFQTWRFVKPRKTPAAVLDVSFRNISTSSPREKDPEVIIDKGNLKIENLYPGTMVTVYFEGWIDGPDTAVDWDRMMTSFTVDEGDIDIGSPSATVFARFLTIFF